MRRLFALVGMLLVGAGPSALPPAPQNAQTALVRSYVEALKEKRYGDAYAMLVDGARAYFRTADNYASVYRADQFAIESYTVAGARGDDRGRVIFVREKIAFRDPAKDAIVHAPAVVPYGVLPTRAGLRIKDPGKPWRAFASNVSASANALTIAVRKVSFFSDRIEVVLTFTNTGTGFVTLLPYGRTVLHDDTGAIYRSITTKNWQITDKQLYEGARLAPNAHYTAAMSFSAPALDDRARTFSLTVGPTMGDGADAPFSLDINGIVPAA